MWRWILVAAGGVSLAGCSGPLSLSVDDPVFAGLDPMVVEEVLDSPVTAERVEGDDEATAKGRYQSMARNFAACRSALWVYQEWVKTGVAPAFPAQPRPVNPSSGAVYMDRDIDDFTRIAAGGDIDELRRELTSDGTCGIWIPAKPRDLSGPTISDVVKRAGR